MKAVLLLISTNWPRHPPRPRPAQHMEEQLHNSGLHSGLLQHQWMLHVKSWAKKKKKSRASCSTRWPRPRRCRTRRFLMKLYYLNRVRRTRKICRRGWMISTMRRSSTWGRKLKTTVDQETSLVGLRWVLPQQLLQSRINGPPLSSLSNSLSWSINFNLLCNYTLLLGQLQKIYQDQQ